MILTIYHTEPYMLYSQYQPLLLPATCLSSVNTYCLPNICVFCKALLSFTRFALSVSPPVQYCFLMNLP